MSAVVIDTNVAVVANGRACQASKSCVVRCIQRLLNVRDRDRVVLDDGMRILREYMSNLSMSGQPGPGDYFMKWLWQNQSVPARCEQVSIIPLPDDPEDFQEFPKDDRLSAFDRSDRKFVAVAKASENSPAVLNATDSDWWDHREALSDNGVTIEFLCPELFEARNPEPPNAR